MSVIAIDINDAGIVVADRSGVLSTEPGYAYVENREVRTGSEAYARSRLHPRSSSNRYWDALSLEPEGAGIEGVGTMAELAFAQLSALWSRFGADAREAVLLVPAHYGRDQLGILLGLAQECGMPVRTMVGSAVAAAVAPYPGCQLVHLDAGLHRVTATPLEQADDVAALSAESLGSAGIASIMDSLAKRVAELFVLETRFDPFHSAASEQQVFDRLPGLLAELEGRAEPVSLQLKHGDQEVAVEIEPAQLVGVLAGFHRAVVQLVAQCREPGADLVVLLSERLAVIPGIVGELERLDDSRVVTLGAGAAAQGALRRADALGGGGGAVRLLKRLPWCDEAAAVASPRAPQRSQAPPGGTRVLGTPPSHIVYRGTAYAVDARGLLIGREASPDRRTIVLNGGQSGVSRTHCELVRRDGELKLVDNSRYGTFVNEKRVSGEVALQPADVIRIGTPGEQLQVIRMEAADGA